MRRISQSMQLGLGGLLMLLTACDGTITFETGPDDDDAASSGSEPESTTGEPDNGSTSGSSEGSSEGSSDGHMESGEPACGDDMIEGDEVCDGNDLDGQTCVSLGLGEGELGCSEDCMAFDPAGCSVEMAQCGNGVIEAGEICDGDALAGETCASQGLDEGTLGCREDCTAFDDSECVDWVGDCCAANESPGCDDLPCTEAICELDSYCCETEWDALCAGMAQTNVEDAGVCMGTGGSCGGLCGDGVVGVGEVCDGALMGEATCESEGFEGGGTLACDAGCGAFDTSGCVDWVGECCASNGSPGCDDAACAMAVCEIDPYCCSNSWDGFCMGYAMKQASCAAAPGC